MRGTLDKTMALSRPFERHVRPLYWVVLSVLCLAIDYVSGPGVQFPVAYLAPISMASWHGGRLWGLVLAVALPLGRFFFHFSWDSSSTLLESSVNAAIRITVFVVFALLIDRTARQMRELRHMHVLERMLGVCSVCRRIRDEQSDGWQTIDDFIAGHPDEFVRDVCPGCSRDAREAFDRR